MTDIASLTAALDAEIAKREQAERTILTVVDILNNSRHAFRSKQVEQARRMLETLLPQRDGGAA